ncbi:DNA-binding protein [Sulfitobacter sp. NFXS29]
MAVQDELLALCAELHSSGIKLSYDTILKARGRGSRRDIAAALREWHRRRARELASASLVMPDHVWTMGSDLVMQLWSAMEGEFAELRREIALEADLLEHHAQEEIEHLHGTIGEQHEEILRLKNEVNRLSAARP